MCVVSLESAQNLSLEGPWVYPSSVPSAQVYWNPGASMYSQKLEDHSLV